VSGQIAPTAAAACTNRGAVSTASGRRQFLFVSFPRWADDVRYTVAEIVDGKAVAYPDRAINEWSEERNADQLVSVQSVITDPAGHMWLLDTGSLSFAPWLENGPKLVEVDPATDQVVRLDPAAVTATTYLNDVRFDFSRAPAGTPISPTPISADGSLLYYCPLSSRRLYSVETSALLDRSLDDDQVADTVVDLGDEGASDGLESDTGGAVYSTAYEHSAVLRRDADGTWSTVLHGPPVVAGHLVTETGREAGERMRAMIQWVDDRMSTVVDARAAYDRVRAERDAAAEAPPVTGTH
jgi:sugar lactone lactonase YvrE